MFLKDYESVKKIQTHITRIQPYPTNGRLCEIDTIEPSLDLSEPSLTGFERGCARLTHGSLDLMLSFSQPCIYRIRSAFLATHVRRLDDFKTCFDLVRYRSTAADRECTP